MAITLKQKEKFIDLRSDGLSFNTIAKKLSISKSTLINLQLELEDKIRNAAYFKYQTILEKYKLKQQNNIEYHSKLLEKVKKELEDRDLTILSFKELIQLKEHLNDNLKIFITYKTDEFEENEFGIKYNRTISLD
ncbi:MAG: hypothetical protein IIA48_04075 [Bacteroidetes bacterium]|nr:hypothetical protein [Bacteroidota bacterium]